MTKFNINKVICINLKSNSEKQLKDISEVYTLSYEALLRSKQRGTHKIWIEPGGNYAIAALETSNPDDFYICERFCPISKKEREMVKKIKPINSPKVKKSDKVSPNRIEKAVKESFNIKITNDVNVNLNLDSILDKINLKGMESLTKEEINFLKNYK